MKTFVFQREWIDLSIPTEKLKGLKSNIQPPGLRVKGRS